MAEESKPLNYISEVVLKKRRNNEDWAIKRREQSELRKQRNKQDKKLVFKRAEEYIKEYRNKELDFIQMKHRKKQWRSSSALTPESKLLFIIRIRGTNDMCLKTRKILHSLKLRSIYSGVFVKANEAVMDMLRRVEPYVTYGYPNLKSVKELIYKKGYGKIDKEKAPLTDNNMIEQALGKHGIICIEDIVHEITTVGPHFKDVVNFLWPFKLNRPEGGKLLKKTSYKDGGDAGNREVHINELLDFKHTNPTVSIEWRIPLAIISVVSVKSRTVGRCFEYPTVQLNSKAQTQNHCKQKYCLVRRHLQRGTRKSRALKGKSKVMTRLSTQKILEENQTRQSTSITALVLNQKALSDVSCLSDFKNLEKLDLGFNNLTSLEGLSSCTNLKWLSVVQNKLQSLKGIERLCKLTVLNAGKNKLRSMSEVSHLISVRALILNDNEISSICILDQLKDLNTLVLSRNPIREIGDSLVKVKSITKLSLSNCQLQNIGSSFMSLADLKEVRLAHNEITTVPVELAHNIRLQNLDMGNNYISNWSDLKVLSSLQNLKNLNLQGNPIAQNDKLAKKVKKLVPNLQIFNSRPIERGKENEKNFKKDVKGHKADDSSPNKASDLKDPKEVRKEYPSNEKISRKRISSQSKDDPLDNGTDSDMEREELKQKKSKTNKLPKKNVTGGNKDDDELENRSNRKNPKKVEETKLDMIDDGETPFMDLIISSSTENTRDGNKTKMGVEADAFVTFPVKKKKKSKSVRMSSAALQLLSSTADVGTGGPSTWDA